MAPHVSNRLLILTFLSYTICQLPFTSASTCYRLDGSPFAKIRPDDGEWKECSGGTGGVSSCCSVKDYCLGNGLCLDAGANNYFSVQGCTDSQWGAPCVTNNACKKNMVDGYSFIWPCGQVNDSSYSYCCGKSPSCCENKADLIAVQAVTEIARPTTASSSTASSSAAGSTTETGTPAAATVTATAAAADGSSGSDGKILAIGLGAGLGIGFLLLGAVSLFVLLRLRKKYAHPRAEGGNGTRPQSSAIIQTDNKSPTTTSPTPVMTQHSPAPMAHQTYAGAAEKKETSSYPPVQYQELESPPTATAQWNGNNYNELNGQQQQASASMSATGGSAWYGEARP